MSKELRYLALACGAVAFAAVYLLGGALHLPSLWYAPLAHRWSFAPGPGVAMGWYGHALDAALIGAAAAGACLLLGRGRRPGPRVVAAATVALIATYAAAIAYVLVAA